MESELERKLLEDSLWYEDYIQNLERRERWLKTLVVVGYSIVAVLCVAVGILFGFSLKYSETLCG